jgi:hypothetical protein
MFGVFPSVPKSELVSEAIFLATGMESLILPTPVSQASGSSGYGGIHAAILSLAARCFGTNQWLQNVYPQTDSERLDANSTAPGPHLRVHHSDGTNAYQVVEAPAILM